MSEYTHKNCSHCGVEGCFREIESIRQDLAAAKRDELRARAGIYRGMVQEMQATGASGVNLEKVEGWAHIAENDAADAIQALEDPTRAQRLRKIAHSIKTIIAEARSLDVIADSSAEKAFEGFGNAFEALAEFEERKGPPPPKNPPVEYFQEGGTKPIRKPLDYSTPPPGWDPHA